MQFDSSSLEGSIQDVKVTTLELKAELSKNSQKLLALTSRLDALDRRPQRSTTRNPTVASARMESPSGTSRAASSNPAPVAANSPSPAVAGTNGATISGVGATAAAGSASVAQAPAESSGGGRSSSNARSGNEAGPSMSGLADAANAQQTAAARPVSDSTSLSGTSQSFGCSDTPFQDVSIGDD